MRACIHFGHTDNESAQHFDSDKLWQFFLVLLTGFVPQVFGSRVQRCTTPLRAEARNAQQQQNLSSFWTTKLLNYCVHCKYIYMCTKENKTILSSLSVLVFDFNCSRKKCFCRYFGGNISWLMVNITSLMIICQPQMHSPCNFWWKVWQNNLKTFVKNKIWFYVPHFPHLITDARKVCKIGQNSPKICAFFSLASNSYFNTRFASTRTRGSKWTPFNVDKTKLCSNVTVEARS